MAALCLLTTFASADERGAERAFEKARRTEPELLAFLAKMPKGGDLHSHISGAVYADSMLDAAIAKGLYFDPATARFGTSGFPAKDLLTDNAKLYRFLNAASMRGWDGLAQSGHDHFFDTFGIFGNAVNAMDEREIFTQVIGRAKRQNLQYMELMANPVPSDAWAEYTKGLPTMPTLADLQPRFEKLLKATSANIDARDAMAGGIGQSSFTSADEPMTVRWVFSINRLADKATFFASAAAGIYLAAHEPRVAAMNMVAPEDHPASRIGFPWQMDTLDSLWSALGKPNLTLHAGELTAALSPPEAMSDRIRATIEKGHARRIGHGVSIAAEDDLDSLLAKMKREGIAVEICLSSNASILGVSGDRHPFRLYRAAGVPVFLNTDDEGVSRSTMTHEWMRAVREQGVSYLELKEMARNSLEYSFLPGRSLYEGRDYARLADPFRDARKADWKPGADAEAVLRTSEKMRVQLRLERAFASFESRYP